MSNTGENAETLEWVYGYESTAETVLGTYTIDLASNVFFEGEHIGSETDTSLKAKEIAQADFDRRVRSAPTVSLILRLENERDVMREKAISNARERNDAEARIAELEAQGWELSGSITDLGQRLETAETLLEEARWALIPFRMLADNVFSDGKNATVADEVTLWCFNDTDITFGDLRRARATHDRIGKCEKNDIRAKLRELLQSTAGGDDLRECIRDIIEGKEPGEAEAGQDAAKSPA